MVDYPVGQHSHRGVDRGAVTADVEVPDDQAIRTVSNGDLAETADQVMCRGP